MGVSLHYEESGWEIITSETFPQPHHEKLNNIRGTYMKRFVVIIGRILLHPAMVFSSIFLGSLAGILSPTISAYTRLPSQMYLAFLQMCVLPIMMAAVVVSVSRLLRSGRANEFILGVTAVFLAGMLLAAAMGVGLGIIGQTGSDIGKESRILMGQEISNVEMAMGTANDTGISEPANEGPGSFLLAVIPQNIFKAVSDGRNLSVLFFCIIMGIALGSIRTTNSDTAIAVTDAIYEAMLRIIGWTLYALPFGLFCLFATQISQIGTGIFFSLIKLIVFLYAGCMLLLILYLFILCRRAKKSLRFVLRALRQALVVGFGTSNGFAALPFALEGLHKKLGFGKDTVDLIIPLGTTLNPHGNAICFGMVAVFIAQLYDIPLSVGNVLAIIPLAALAGIVASSAPGLASVAMLALVLDPFQLPTLVAIILVSAINPVIDPILTVVNILGNCASTALVATPADHKHPPKTA